MNTQMRILAASALAVLLSLTASCNKGDVENVTEEGENQSSVFTKTIWRNQYGEDVEFEPDGSFSETYHGSTLTGTWETVTDTEVKVLRSDQTTWHFIVLPDESITRRGHLDTVWKQLKKR